MPNLNPLNHNTNANRAGESINAGILRQRINYSTDSYGFAWTIGSALKEIQELNRQTALAKQAADLLKEQIDPQLAASTILQSSQPTSPFYSDVESIPGQQSHRDVVADARRGVEEARDNEDYYDYRQAA